MQMQMPCHCHCSPVPVPCACVAPSQRIAAPRQPPTLLPRSRTTTLQPGRAARTHEQGSSTSRITTPALPPLARHILQAHLASHLGLLIRRSVIVFNGSEFLFPPSEKGVKSLPRSAWYEQLAGELEGCQWRRSSKVELFELGFWFWLCELGWGRGKGARLAGLARVGVGGGGGGGGGGSHQATTCGVIGGGGGACERKQVMAEPAKAVQAKGEDGTGARAVQAVEKVKEPEAQEEEEEVEYDVEELLAQHQDLIDSMLTEGILDDQFSQLQMLQDESTPDFVEELVTLFFDDSVKLLENLTESLKTDPVDFKVVDSHVHQFKGSSSSIGAQRIKQVCITFRTCCDNKDKKGCRDHLVKVKEEFNIVRSKLGKMLELERKIVDAGGVLPFVEY